MTSAPRFQSFKEKLNKQSLVILDIDSTLVTTYQRNQVILDGFTKAFAEIHPEDCEKIKTAQCQLGDYGYFTSFERIGYEFSNEKVKEDLSNFWKRHFFANTFLNQDLPTPGAVEFVKQLEAKKIPFVYLTGRFKGLMWDGTLESLKNLGFPIHPEILTLKEDTTQKDEIYKSEAISHLKKQYPGHTFSIIDNEPAILHQTRKDHPDVEMVWFDSCHSGRKEPLSDVITIQSF